MKLATGRSIIVVLALVMTVTTGAFALNFDDGDDPYPRDRKKVEKSVKSEAAAEVESVQPATDMKRTMHHEMDMKKSTPHEKKAEYHHGKNVHGTSGHHGKPCAMKCPLAISHEEMNKLKAERDSFITGTRDLRMEIKSKRLAIRSEIAKPSPDVKTALALQRELSALEARLGEKRVRHQLEMKKISPMAEMGCMGMNRGCMGKGMGGAGMGKGCMGKDYQKMRGDCPMMGK